MKILTTLTAVAALIALPSLGLAQDTAADATPTNADIGFIFTTFMFLVTGVLVFWMAAGFSMLEAGLVRSKNVTMQLTKNMALFSLASLFYYLVGYNLMYPGDGWTIDGLLGAFSITGLEPVGLEGVEPDLTYASVGSDFFFQLMFAAATASIVSGAVAERIKLWEEVNREDREKLERMQISLRSEHAQEGPLAGEDYEGTIRDFQSWLAQMDALTIDQNP